MAGSRAAQDFRTTCIGSLPHHNVDAALQFAASTDIPFLPQIPIRNPWEFMLAQALEGLPGLSAESDGSVALNLEIWESRRASLDQLLSDAFSRAPQDPQAFAAFEPSPAISSCWQPYVWDLGERGIKAAKVQIAGPLTAQWSLRTKDSSPADRRPEIAMQIYRLVLARALALTRRLQASQIKPILFLDEPGLYGLLPTNAKHAVGLQELKLMIQSLRKEGVQVGLHCCSNTDWSAILGLGLDIISIDVALSLSSLLSPQHSSRLAGFLKAGGRLSLGVIPTARSSVLHSLDPKLLATSLTEHVEDWATSSAGNSGLAKATLSAALYTPACGLALHSVADAELVLELLKECAAEMRALSRSPRNRS